MLLSPDEGHVDIIAVTFAEGLGTKTDSLIEGKLQECVLDCAI